MKIKALTLAIAAAATLPQAAFAVDPAITPDFVFRLSGATAAESLFRLTLVNEVCASDIAYLRDGSSGAGTQYGVYCVASSSSPVPASIQGKKVLFLKHGAGGSASGVHNLIQSLQSSYINRTTCVSSGTQTIGASSYPAYSCGTYNDYSHAGYSDGNPELFTGPNQPYSASAITSSQVSAAFTDSLGTAPKGVLAQVFSLVASTNLWNALQAVQVAQGSLPASCTSADTSEACTPTISKELAASFFAGKVTSWNNVQVTLSGTNYPINAVTGITGPSTANPAPVATGVKLCRRTPGSGTGATIHANVLGNPCLTNGYAVPIAGNTGNVFAGSGSGDTEKCLQAWNSGASQTANTETSGSPTTFSATVNPANQTGWAVGLMSTERATNANYRFLKLDNVYPSAENTQQGKYQMWAEGTIQYVPAGAASAGAIATAGGLVLNAGSAERDFIDYLKDAMSKFSNVSQVNAGLPRPAYLALSTQPGNTPLAKWDATQPVIGFTHGASGNPNNCAIPVWNTSFPTVAPWSK